VSRHWAEVLRRDHGVGATVIANGVDGSRFATCPLDRAAAGRTMGWGGRPTVLAVGGIEPRKGSRTLLAAFAGARERIGPGALLASAGGETLFDYADYRDAWEQDAGLLGLRVHRGPAPPPEADVAVLGPIPDDDMPALFRGADLFAFPSEREGFGLVVLEAQAAGLPVVASDLPVLGEFLRDGEDCRMVPVGDADALALALVETLRDAGLRERLVAGGRATASRFTWAAAAAAHEEFYEGAGAS
jgi:glycosyltransferase involved in cell wall biosynthesis